jgi:hypothetical protein
MRKTAIIRIGVFLGLAALVMGAKCPKIPETHEVEITLVTEEFVELLFEARGSMNVDSSTEVINIAQLRQDLEDAGIETELIKAMKVSKVEYGTVDYYESGTDRRIVDADVSLERVDNSTSAVIVDGLSVDVYPLLGVLEPVPTETAGIAFVNDLLEDILDAIQHGGVSNFVVVGASSGTSTPTGRDSNFDWRVRIYYQIAGGMPTDVPEF